MASDLLKSLSRKGGHLAPFIDNWFVAHAGKARIPFEINMDKEKDDAFHPSSDPLSCMALIYGRTRKEIPGEVFSAEQNKTFAVGHMYHGMLQWVLVEGLGFATWDDIEREHRQTISGKPLPITEPGTWQDCLEIQKAKSEGDWWMRGSSDVSSCVIPGEGDFLVDIKTARSRSFEYADLSGKYGAKYVAQAQMYMDWFGKDKTIILYQNKDGPHDFKELYVHRDRDFVEEVYDRWAQVATGLFNQEPPPCDCPRDANCPGRSKYHKRQAA